MQLQQVLMNLCLNARDAMPHGGRLVVRTWLEPEGGRVRLTVEDTGQGMPRGADADLRPVLLDQGCGTGLGLAVVQQIIESFGGRVEVWSRPGEGSHFDVWLPRDPGMDANEQEEADRGNGHLLAAKR